MADQPSSTNTTKIGETMPDGAGPPWEMPGSWPKRYFETLWLSYRHPFLLFREMRREGSLWMPFAYLILSMTIIVVLSLLLGSEPQWDSLGAFLFGPWLYFAANLPLAILLAGIVQLSLAISGPRKPFRATLRSTFYVMGSSLLMGLLGYRASWLALAVQVILQFIAIREVHRISSIRAVVVVLCAMLLLAALPFGIYLIMVVIAPRHSGSV